MKIIELDILSFADLAQIQLNMPADKQIFTWDMTTSQHDQIMSFLVFLFYGKSADSWSSELLAGSLARLETDKIVGGSISFLHNNERYLLERIINSNGGKESIKLLNESKKEDLSANCSAQPGWDLFSMGQDEFIFALGLAPLPSLDFISSKSQQVADALALKLESYQNKNGEKGKDFVLAEQLAKVRGQIEVAEADDLDQAKRIERIYLLKNNISQQAEKLAEVAEKISRLELLEDKARYENLLLLRRELTEAEEEEDNISRKAQEKNLPSALEMTSYEDLFADWNNKARNLQKLRSDQAIASEDVKEGVNRCNLLKNELDLIEQKESSLENQLAQMEVNLRQAKAQKTSPRSGSTTMKIVLLATLTGMAGLLFLLANLAVAAYILIGLSVCTFAVLLFLLLKQKSAGNAVFGESRRRIIQVQDKLTEIRAAKNELLWKLQAEIDVYQQARQQEENAIKELSNSEKETNFAGYELVNALSRYIKIHYPEEAARALKELRSRIIDAGPALTRTSKILNQISALKAGKTDEEIEQDYERAAAALFGSALEGDKEEHTLPTISVSRYNPEVLVNAKAKKLRLEIEHDQSVRELKSYLEDMSQSSSLVNLADLHRQKRVLEEKQQRQKDEVAAIQLALKYLAESKSYRTGFYRQIEEMSRIISAQISIDKEIYPDSGLTRALALRQVTSGAEGMPLIISSAMENYDQLNLPARIMGLYKKIPQLIVINAED